MKAGLTGTAVGVTVVFVFVVWQHRRTRGRSSRTSVAAELLNSVIVGRLAEEVGPLVFSLVSEFLEIVNQRDAGVWPKCPDDD